MVFEELNRALGMRLVQTDIAQRFMLKMKTPVDTQIHTPDDVLGERFMRIGTICLTSSDYPELLHLLTDPGDDHGRVVRWIAERGMAAVPYLWTNNIIQELHSNTDPLPRHVISKSILPAPQMWWTSQSSFAVHKPDGEELPWSVDVEVLSDEGDGFTMASVGGSFTQPDLWIEAGSIRYGSIYPDDFVGDQLLPTTQVLRKLAFLNSPFIGKEIRRASRPARRSAGREGIALPEVSFIDLRRSAPRDPSSSEEHQDVSWKHRWIVSGHMRAQWYPKEKAHHLIYIAPYMKGPDEAPLIEHVNRVRR